MLYYMFRRSNKHVVWLLLFFNSNLPLIFLWGYLYHTQVAVVVCIRLFVFRSPPTINTSFHSPVDSYYHL